MNVFAKYTSKETFEKIVDYNNVSEMWEHSVKTFPNNVAIIDVEPITYKQLDDEVAKMRQALIEKGIQQGDRVGIFMPNSKDFAKTFLAITTLGAVAALLPPQLPGMAVLGCAMKFNLKGLVYANVLSEQVKDLQEKKPDVILMTEKLHADEKAAPVFVDKDEPCAILFTGGTTGKNKGALLSNRALMRGVKNGCYGTYDVFEQRYLLVLPLTHVFGLVRNLLVNLYTGSTLYIVKNNKDMFKDIAIFRPTILVLVPALAEMALNLSKQFKRNMLGDSLKYIICGAAAVPPYLVVEYKKLNISLLPGYGLTESANLVSGNPEPLTHSTSVGYMYEGMEYKIVDDELWLKGVNMMDSYVGEPEENKLAYEDGWFKTGDLVKMDKDGFLYIIGRKKEIIVLPSGENVSPAEVEAKFGQLDVIQDCLLYEQVENNRSSLVLEVLPRATVLKELNIEDAEKYIKEEINKINEGLPSYEKVSKVIIRDKDFLRSPSMKILRNQNEKK